MLKQEFAIEFTKALSPALSAAAWPTAILVMVFWLRRSVRGLIDGPLARLIDRAVTVRGGIFETTTVPPQPQQQSDKAADLTEMDQLVTREAVEAELPFIRSLLEKMDLGSGKAREEAFVRILTGLHLKMIYEKLYIFIYGSQIAALKEINASGGLDDSRLASFFEVGKARNPELYRTFSLQQWKGFLTDSKLATQEGGKLVVTIAGKGFLSFLLKQGLSELKPG